jgi:hypothetical protein
MAQFLLGNSGFFCDPDKAADRGGAAPGPARGSAQVVDYSYGELKTGAFRGFVVGFVLPNHCCNRNIAPNTLRTVCCRARGAPAHTQPPTMVSVIGAKLSSFI